jgi:hypothetical protein
MSEDFGAVKVSLQDLGPRAWIKLIPSKNEQDFKSEMILNAVDAKKFNLKIGGHINTKDSFYLLNCCPDTKQKYYLNVDRNKVFCYDGYSKSIEVSASLKPNKFRTKMFMSYSKAQKDRIYSGDIVRLLHVESGCYVMSEPRLSGNRTMFSAYPDFLHAEISDLKQQQESWEGEFKTLNFATEEASLNLLNDSNQDEEVNLKTQENYVKNTRVMFLETETRAQSFTDSCFEIQN